MNETKSPWWAYENLPSGEPYDWGGAARGDRPDDQHDFHLDLGCGRLKKGRLGIDRFKDPGVDLVMDLDALWVGGEEYNEAAHLEDLIPVQGRMPFPSDSIKSIVSHHALEHIGEGFIRLVDECYRILEPNGFFRIIVPLFPSHSAFADPDHKRWFGEGTFETFCADMEGNHWMESFSTPYTASRFLLTNKDMSPRSSDPSIWWTEDDQREIRVTLTKPERTGDAQ